MNRFLWPRAASKCWAACATALLGISGCTSRQNQEIAERALAAEAKSVKSNAGELKHAVIKDWAFAGQDEQHRPLWKLSAHEARIGEGDQLNPRRATLLDARVELFRDGKVESYFQAARIEFLDTPQGLRLQMSDGVKMRSVVAAKRVSQTDAIAAGPVEISMPRADVSVRSRRLFAADGASVQQGKGDKRVDLSARQLKADTGLAITTIAGLQAVSRGATTQAKSATWNWKTGRIEASGEVKATRENTVLRGDRLLADTQVRVGVLSGHVRAQSDDGGRQGRVGAGALHFNWSNGSLSARDGVLLERDGGTVRANRIDTDLKLNGALATGGVELRKDGATLNANRVQAFDRLTRAVASGAVTLVRQNARVQAGRVEARGLDNQSTLTVLANEGVRLSRDDLQVRAARVEASGLGDESTLSVLASGGASARNGQGSVQAGRVAWQQHRVVASNGVTLRKDGNTLSGARLDADDRFQNATLSGDVRGVFASGGNVRAETLLKRGQNISASGGMVARRDRLTLRAGKLETTLALEHAVLTKAVELKTADGAIVRAPNLRYEKRLDKAYGSGGVSFVDPARGLRGRGKTIVVNQVSDPKRREAVITDVKASGNEKALGTLKVF